MPLARLPAYLPACLFACLRHLCAYREEMPRLLSEAKSDAEKSGVKLLYSSRNMSYCEFLEDYGSA